MKIESNQKVVEKKQKKEKNKKKKNIDRKIYLPLGFISFLVLLIIFSIVQTIVNNITTVSNESINYQMPLTTNGQAYGIKRCYINGDNLIIKPFISVDGMEYDLSNTEKPYIKVYTDTNEDIIYEGFLYDKNIEIPLNKIDINSKFIIIDFYFIDTKDDLAVKDPLNEVVIDKNVVDEKINLKNYLLNKNSDNIDIKVGQKYLNDNFINKTTVESYPPKLNKKVENEYLYKNEEDQYNYLLNLITNVKIRAKIEINKYLSVGMSKSQLKMLATYQTQNVLYYKYDNYIYNYNLIKQESDRLAPEKVIELESTAKEKNVDMAEYEANKANMNNYAKIEELNSLLGVA